MICIFLLCFLFLFCVSVCFRLSVLHPVNLVHYTIKDAYMYIKFKESNRMQTGKLIAYTALFGGGKTLSCVHYIMQQYKLYNDKPVYDHDRKKWVTQKVHVISNVDLSIPYEHFESLGQIVRVANKFREMDLENDTLTCTLVLGDEFSVQMNSRSFKTNIDPLFLNTLLTCRHHHITLVYNAQRFNHVDALLRQVTSYVIECQKVWRFMVQREYDAYTLENSTDPTLVKPRRNFGWFICDRDFKAYDTLACVGNLEKAVREGDMESEIEIINRQANNVGDIENIANPSRKLRKIRKRKK